VYTGSEDHHKNTQSTKNQTKRSVEMQLSEVIVRTKQGIHPSKES
jgi:hypothetical protein